jgi:hypothetical protein
VTGRQERLFGPDPGPGIVVLGIADRAEVDRVGGGAGCQILVAQRHAVSVDGDAADQDLLPLEAEAEEATGGLEDAPAARNHLGADPITGNDDEAVGGGGLCHVSFSTRSETWPAAAPAGSFSPIGNPSRGDQSFDLAAACG